MPQKIQTANMIKNGANVQLQNKHGVLYYLKKDKHLYLMLIPGIVFFLVFYYAPMYGVLVAFKDYNIYKGFMASEWIGFENFRNFFNDMYFFRLVRNTFLLSFYTLLFGFPMPIILALSFNEVRNQHFKKVTQTISYLPHFISTVVVVGIISTLTAENGIFNQLALLFTGHTIKFSVQPEWFRPLYVGSGIWQSMGWSSIIYLAALAGIDPGLYEAATMDGAGRFSKMRHISIPGILPVIVIQLILQTGGLMSVGFEKAYLMQNEAIYETADVIATYVYRRGMIDADYGYSTAVGVFNSLVGLVLTLIVNFIASKVNETTLF